MSLGPSVDTWDPGPKETAVGDTVPEVPETQSLIQPCAQSPVSLAGRGPVSPVDTGTGCMLKTSRRRARGRKSEVI